MQTLDARYRINGMLSTDNSVLQNLEAITNSCGTWLTFDAVLGKWSVVINRPQLPSWDFTDDNITGSINLTTLPMESFYNSVEVRYHNINLRDQADYVRITIPEAQRYPNERDQQMTITAPFINNQIQAQLIGLIELRQSRLEQTIEFQTDYSASDLEAGQVVTVTNTVYGWIEKQFRIIKLEQGELNNSIVINITAQEYDVGVYNTDSLFEYLIETSDGLIELDPLVDVAPITPYTQIVDANGDPTENSDDLWGLLGAAAATGLLNSITADGETLTESVDFVAGENITIDADPVTRQITFTSTGGGGTTTVTRTITNITQANPAVVTTSEAHGFINGQSVTITDVVGMTQVNGNSYYASIASGTTFAIYTDADLTIPVDSTGFTAYTSAGTVTAIVGSAVSSGGVIATGSTPGLGTPVAASATNLNIVTELSTGARFSLTEPTTVGIGIDIYTTQFNQNTLDGTDFSAGFRYTLEVIDQSTDTVVVSNNGLVDWVRTMRYLRPVDMAHAELAVTSLPPGNYALQLGGTAGNTDLYVGFRWFVFRRA